MPKNSLLKRPGRMLLANMALTAAGMAFMHASYAGCGQYDAPLKKADWQQSSSGNPRFIRTGYQQIADESPDWGHREEKPAITGLWYFKYLSKGNKALGIPDGATVDDGNTIWFADGNEMTSSGMRAPNTGSICLGTWKKTGERTYALNHIGLSWDPVHNVFAGPAFIKQFVTLEKGDDKYSGVFTITQFAADGKTVDVELKGVIVATRVTVETDTQP